MSLFDDIAHAIGHTVESLAMDVGAGVYELESLINDLADNGIDVFSVGERFGLSTVDFLRSMVTILRSDPHEQLLYYITRPFKPVNELVEELSAQWEQMAQFHQDTAQMINMHISAVFQGNGTFSYSGPAAETLWDTHLDYLSSFNEMVNHAQTQQGRYATLGGHFGDFLSEAPRKVYSLSAPMAALGVLSFEASSPVLDQPIEQWFEQGLENLEVDEEASPPPINVLILVIMGIVALCVLILIIFFWIKSAVDDHNKQQKNTTVPSVKHKAVPTVTSGNGYSQPMNLTDAQKRLLQDVKSRLGMGPYDDTEIEALILAGYLDPNAIAAMMKNGSFAAFDDATIANMMNTLTDAQQLKFVNIVDQYQKTHPGLTSHQVYNYLRYTKMKAQAELLAQDIRTSSIANRYPAATARLLNDRLLKFALNPMLAVTDPFTVADGQLGDNGGGWYANVTGVWAEWSRVKYYDQTGQLQDFSVPFTPSVGKPGETDIILKDGTWVEVKNVPNMDYSTSAWDNLKKEMRKYVNGGARRIRVDLPQGLPTANKTRLVRQLEAIGNAQGITIDVQYPSGIPFDPPAGNWGNNLPIISTTPLPTSTSTP